MPVVKVTNALDPHRCKEIIPITQPMRIRAWLDEQGIDEFELPTICTVNGKPILRKDWAITVVTDYHIVSFITLPKGGGGGGNKILRTVLMVAVMVASIYTGGAVAAAYGATWGAIAGAAVSIVGNLLINVLVPAPTPNLGGDFGGQNIQNPSPTYSLQARSNRARLGEVIPVIYGRHIVYPDLATSPYTEYENNEQFLHQLHVIGQGDYEVEAPKIDDTPISSFEEIQYQILKPGDSNTLFNSNVVTAPEVAGQELLAVVDEGDWIGGFMANPPGTETDSIGIDVVLPRGLYYANDSGGLSDKSLSFEFEARRVDDKGNPLEPWTVIGNHSLTMATNTPQRFSYRYAVANGRYEVRAIRLDQKDTNSRASHEVRWQSLRTYLLGDDDFGDLTMIALKMRATDNLSQRSSRMVNCIVTRKLPIWNPSTGWSHPQATRSIAWAIADACKNEYGAKLPDNRIDLEALYNLDTLWQSRQDYFDGVFDQTFTVWEVLSRIARCGRAVMFLQGGIVRIVRDEARTMPVALFSTRNIVKNSLAIDYLMASEETADSVTVEYFSSTTWKPDEITVALPDSTTEQPAKVQLTGCTEEGHARREGMYMAAANRYRRKIIKFSTELEGLIPTYGDLIAISHDMPGWGQAGEIVARDGDVLTVSEPLTWEEGKTHYVSLRAINGSVTPPLEVVRANHDYKLQVLDSLDGINIQTDNQSENTHFAFGVGQDWSVKARVLSVKPRSEEQVEITAVAEHEAVHQAEAL